MTENVKYYLKKKANCFLVLSKYIKKRFRWMNSNYEIYISAT